MGTQIPDLDPILTVDGNELVAARDTLGDVKVSLSQIAAFVEAGISPAEVLAKLVAASPQTNGLNANLLQGFLASHFLNASNLNAGTVPSPRLPQGSYGSDWVPGGAYPSIGTFRAYWRMPRFAYGNNSEVGASLTFQVGWTNFVAANTLVTGNFLIPFTNGPAFSAGGEDLPFMMVAPHVRSDQWPVVIPGISAVELSVGLISLSKTGFTIASNRNEGAGPDNVSAMWLAVGFA
jgi:hypothetical protein